MSNQAIPLCVDLDGTLIRSDMLFESALSLLRRNPFYLFFFLAWLLRGRAHLKREIARRAEVDPVTLPYDERVVAWLRGEAGQRRRVLCTASDAGLAQGIADHLGLFDEVMASDGERNLAGRNKAESLRQRYGDKGFDYAGNEQRDLHIWKHARKAIVVNGHNGLASAAGEHCEVERVFEPAKSGLKVWLQALRLHQWLKNLLVFLPLFAAHRVLEVPALIHCVVAFFAFGLCASGVYVLNDLFDLDADRRHPRKRLRPFAAGTLPLAAGLVMAPLLTLAGLALALAVSLPFAGVLLCYYVLTLAYSLRLKRIVMLDVVVLAALYTVRIIGGAVAVGGGLSFWLLAFSMFLFLSLAMLKRYTELQSMLGSGKAQASGRGYAVDDIALIQSLGGSSGYMSVLVLALYINSTASEALYRHQEVLWLLCPLLLYWISRVWLIAHRGTMHDDPVVFALVDRVSRVVLALCAIVVAGAI
ncbi:4-hydroxybenzoate polyprenyltransferase [Tahibacter aquaticus]|uniref:4-hydroxybenzoate polyprenyltransferase n=1 Tax=Tahibacter aquaticus TaxID=520092 RepID=A0A4R6ZA94_9GAMM|nr:UbiA family prenyltransferase [Tahibacter aquaticus]TDR48805.1 4-hydroxybenzoate polyprenyltransferase [Tahibacter aquaticus]